MIVLFLLLYSAHPAPRAEWPPICFAPGIFRRRTYGAAVALGL